MLWIPFTYQLPISWSKTKRGLVMLLISVSPPDYWLDLANACERKDKLGGGWAHTSVKKVLLVISFCLLYIMIGKFLLILLVQSAVDPTWWSLSLLKRFFEKDIMVVSSSVVWNSNSNDVITEMRETFFKKGKYKVNSQEADKGHAQSNLWQHPI